MDELRRVQKVHIVKGGAGKSTWIKSVVEESEGMVKYINRDLLWGMLDLGQQSATFHEVTVLRARDYLLQYLLGEGFDVIIDEDIPHPDTEKQIRVALSGALDTVEICIHDFGDTEEGLQGEKKTVPMPLVQDEMNPHAIIVDIDDTVALSGGRDPHDASCIHEDIPNKPVIDFIRDYIWGISNKPYYGCTFSAYLLFVTVREEKYRRETNEWLFDHIIYSEDPVCDEDYVRLYMRPTGDIRSDTHVKQDIFHRLIKDNFYVRFVLDDNNQTVEGWRALGLPCFQVA